MVVEISLLGEWNSERPWSRRNPVRDGDGDGDVNVCARRVGCNDVVDRRRLQRQKNFICTCSGDGASQKRRIKKLFFAKKPPFLNRASLCFFFSFQNCSFLKKASDCAKGWSVVFAVFRTMTVGFSLSLFPPLVRSVGEKLERPSCRCFSPLFFLEELQPKLSPFWTVMHCEFLRTCACVSRSSSSSSLWTRSSPRTEGLSCFFFGLVGIAPLSTNGSFSNVGVGVVRPEVGAVKKYDGPKFLGRFGCS